MPNIAYAINFEREPVLASNASLLGTVAAVAVAPIWVVIIQLLGAMGLFMK